MSRAHRQLVHDFIAALSEGNLPDDLFAADMTVWTITSGTAERARYQGGIKMLQSLFPDGLHYTIDAITTEDDRATAEVQARGTLVNGVEYHNNYVFVFRIRAGRIAWVGEYFDTLIVRDKIMPLMQAL